MSVDNLFKGIAVIIDDQVNDQGANINNIIKQISEKKIPTLLFDKIPDETTTSNLQGVSFILLDWRLEDLSEDDLLEGVMLPEGLQEYNSEQNIEFLKKIREINFCPIFIFSNESKESILEQLELAELCTNGKPSNIFIKGKNELKGKNKVFREIESWLKKNPSMYVLKEWENEYQQSKNKLFSDFQRISPYWAKIMWDNFKDDGANESLELGELISKNLHTRMMPMSFKDEIFSNKRIKVNSQDLRKVLEGEKFLKSELLHDDVISTGDVFKVLRPNSEADNPEYTYYLNIRAQCDLVRSSSNIDLYCLKGREIKDAGTRKSKIKINEGHFSEKISHAIVPFIDGGKIIEFHFYDLQIKKWNTLKPNRIGTLLPPHINRIQQKYGLYMQRQGLPRIPLNAFNKEA